MGDIVYSRRGDVTRFAIAEKPNVGWLCGTGCLRIRVGRAPMDTAYVRHYLENPSVKKWLIDEAKGATMPNLNTSILSSLPLLLPPLPEQKRIAAILDKADAIRRKRQEAIRLTEELLRSAFLEMFGDPVTNPKGWEVERLADVCSVAGGLQVTTARANNPISLPYLRVANVHRERLDLSEMKEIRVTEVEAERTILEKGDVLVVEGHGNPDELGRTAVWSGEIPRCTHQNHLIRVRTDLQRIRPAFLSAYLNSSSGRAQMLRLGKTTSGLNTISANNVRGVELLVPPLKRQAAFEAVVSRVSHLKSHLVHTGKTCEDLYASLVYEAFAGSL